MFQNISREDYNEEVDNQYEDVKPKRKIKQIFKIQNIFIYIISFAMSTIGFGSSIAPFGLSIFASLCSNKIPVGIVYILTLIGTYIGFGKDIFLSYLLTTLVFIVSIIIFKPKEENEYKNEQKKLGAHLFLSVLIVQTGSLLFKNFILYDFLTSILLSIITYIFYKIFTNSIIVIKEYGKKSAFTIEEVVGVSLILAIAVSAFKNISIYGLSITNILSIFIILVLGWKNGILIGATSGITIGTILGIIGNQDPILIAAYALSGMIGGIFNRFGKIGVIIGFIAGNAALTFASNGNTLPIIHIREILIASLGLLIVPKNIKIDIEDLFGKTRLLPKGNDKTLEQNEETIYKLNNISQTISEIAQTYCGVAATTVEEKTNNKTEQEKNKQIFITELLNRLEILEHNILYDDLIQVDGQIVEDIFNTLLEKQKITSKDITDIFAKYNNYIIGIQDEESNIIKDIDQVVETMNETYKISKLNFIYKKKIEENKKNISNQLDGVSKVISSIAQDITTQKNQDEEQKQNIEAILQQLDINTKNINLKKENTGRYKIDLYIDTCEQDFNNDCKIEKIEKALTKLLKQPIVNQKIICGKKEDSKTCKQIYATKDNLSMQIGIAKATKSKSIMSGDSILHIKLDDGKYLIAISDGMGSGPEARKSSKIAIKMLERLLTSGFDKDVSIELINSSIILSSEEETYATLDIAILDLYAKTIEFIKNGACPTYIKEEENVQAIKSLTLPAGMLENIDTVIYEKDLKSGNILVMCSDGIIDSVKEADKKETWVQDLLKKIKTEDAQKIADIILKEAIDNGYGIAKDDMSVIVCHII